MKTVEDVLSVLQGGNPHELPWSAIYERIELAQHRREVGFLVGLIAALRACGDQEPQRHLVRVVYQALACVADEGAVAGILEHCEGAPNATVLAAALAEHQPIGRLARFAAEASTPAERDLIAAWLHESVYHGAEPLAYPSLAALEERLRASEHPLGTVPLHLTSLERAHERRHPTVRARSHGTWHVGPRVAIDALDARAGWTCRVVEEVAPDWADRVRAIFVPLGRLTNARVEARRYRLHAPARPDALGAPLLRALAPDCVTGHIEDEDDEVPDLIDPSRVLVRRQRVEAHVLHARLLTFAIGWRCYGTCAGVGPGRARAYDGLAALCGLPRGTPWDAIDAAARSHHIALFETDSPWFERIADDFGCIMLDPSCEWVTVVAATDAD